MIYLAVCELKSPSMSDFLWGLENSGWLRHIKAIMDAGLFIAKVCNCRELKWRGRLASTQTAGWRACLLPISCPVRLCCTEWGAALHTSTQVAL